MPGERILEHPGDRFVASVTGEGSQVFAVEPYLGRVRAGVDQDTYRIDTPLTHREVEWPGVPILGSVQIRIPLEQTAKSVRVAGYGGTDRIPDVASPAGPWPVWLLGSKYVRLDHGHHLGWKRVLANGHPSSHFSPHL